jgi:hypothetical protein
MGRFGYGPELLPQAPNCSRRCARSYLQANDADLRIRSTSQLSAKCLSEGSLASGSCPSLTRLRVSNVTALRMRSRVPSRVHRQGIAPYIRTFPDEFYERLFRLRGLRFPHDSVSRPRYFGHLTNDIIYVRLASGVLQKLRSLTPRRDDRRRKHQLFRRLTEDVGHPKLREHLASVVTIMKLSRSYDDFTRKLDQIHYGRLGCLSRTRKSREDCK